MFTKSLISFALVAATAVSVSAQSAPGLDECIIQCSVSAAVVGGCSSFADIPCVCTSWDFQQAARKCISANCPASDLDAALDLQKMECTAYPSPTGPKTTSGPTKTGGSKPTTHAGGETTKHTTSHATSPTHTSEHTSTPNGAPTHTTPHTEPSKTSSATSTPSATQQCTKNPDVLKNISKALSSISSALNSISSVLKVVAEDEN